MSAPGFPHGMPEGLQRDLAKVEARLREDEQHILHQRAVVQDLEAHHRDPALAQRLLDTFLELQATHLADRDRIAAEIEAEAAMPIGRRL